jgi:predicted  nucleic acid-binding Zn-ribbon protein
LKNVKFGKDLEFMDLEKQLRQLTELMADLLPAVDRLARFQEKTNIEMGEMRLSNMRLGDAVADLQTSNGKLGQSIDKLSVKIDKLSEYENRIEKLERTVFK